MHHKRWLVPLGIALVLLLAAAALWGRPHPVVPISTCTLFPKLLLPIYRRAKTRALFIPIGLSAYDTLAAANVAPATIRWVNVY